MKLSIGLHTLLFPFFQRWGRKHQRDVLGMCAHTHCGTCVDSGYLKMEVEFKSLMIQCEKAIMSSELPTDLIF